MAVTYSAARANANSSRQVFSGTDAVLVKSNNSTTPPTVDVVAVVVDLTTAQDIAAALNGA